MQKGLVSVIIPTYNRAHAVCRAIESVLAQDYPRVEVIVVDDGSRDGTTQALGKYEGHAQVRCISKLNGGVASARNRGIEEARGEFIAMLDSDDLFLPGKLRMQVEALNRIPEAGLIWSDMDAVNSAGQVVGPRHLRKMYGAYRFFPKPQDLFDRELIGPDGHALYAGNVFSPLVLGNIVHTSTMLVRAERIREAGMYDLARFPQRKPGEDHELHLRMSLLGPVAFLDTVTIHYLVGGEDALTHPENNLQIVNSYLEHLEHVLKTYRDRIQLSPQVLTQALADAYGWAGQANFYVGRLNTARLYLLKSLWFRPLAKERWKYWWASWVPRSWIQSLKRAS